MTKIRNSKRARLCGRVLVIGALGLLHKFCDSYRSRGVESLHTPEGPLSAWPGPYYLSLPVGP